MLALLLLLPPEFVVLLLLLLKLLLLLLLAPAVVLVVVVLPSCLRRVNESERINNGLAANFAVLCLLEGGVPFKAAETLAGTFDSSDKETFRLLGVVLVFGFGALEGRGWLIVRLKL